jgi:integrase
MPRGYVVVDVDAPSEQHERDTLIRSTPHFWQNKSPSPRLRRILDAGKIVPHTLRHTAATWLMQRGVSIWQAAGYLGMSPEILDRVYGHHSPDHLRGAATAITGKNANVSVVDEKRSSRKHQKPK